MCISLHIELRHRLATTTTDIELDAQIADSTENCSNITGVAVGNNSEVTTLTNFINEDCNAVTIRGALRVIPEEHTTDVTNVTDVASYFSRPKLVGTFVYDADTSGLISTLVVDNNSLQTNLTNFSRVKGALGYRASVCFRIQAIANPFQAGRIRMAFEPFANTANHNERAPYITPVSQLPGVELDLSESTSAILKIPFIHPDNYFQVLIGPEDNGDLGNLILYAYTPLSVAPGTPAPNVSIWFWLEDFELIGAASTDLVPQSGKFQRNSKNASSAEAAAIPGNISNVLAAGSNLVTWVGKKIPLISSYSGPASWVLREAGNIAASYGWSKPIQSIAPTKVMNTMNIHQFNCDGPDTAFNLGATTDNAVVPYSGFAGTDVDEMAFSYMTSLYAAISTPTLNSIDAFNTIVYSCALGPRALYNNGTTTNRRNGGKVPGTFFYPGPMYSLANIFRYWKGGIKFRIKIAKTKFHTGRLILGFNPTSPNGAQFVNTPLEPSDMQFKSVIWDLREGNVVDFDCPFVSPLPYLDTIDSYGTFFISVLDPLTGPDTVATTAPMVIEVAGMDDVEFSVPITPVEVVPPLNGVYFPQAGEFEPVDTTDKLPMAQLCVGEKLNSVKQLINRAQPFAAVRGGISTTVSSNFLYPIWSTSSINPTGLTRIDNSYLAYFQSCFALARGGFVVDSIPTRPVTILSAVSNMAGPNVDNMAIVTEDRTGLHVKMPYYNKRSKHLTGPTNYSEPANSITVGCSGDGTRKRAIISRRAAEDFQLGYYIGAQPLTQPFTATTPLADSIVEMIAETNALAVVEPVDPEVDPLLEKKTQNKGTHIIENWRTSNTML